MREIDWLELWRELVTRNFHPERGRLVERYKSHTRNRVEKRDLLLDFVLQELDEGDTAIDIGAGTGRWTIPLARKIRNVTAVEPTSGMMDMLRQNLHEAALGNVDLLLQTWEEATPSIHDVALCAHGMYGSPDLAAFVRKMEDSTHKRCYVAVRLPPADGIIAELSIEVYGCRHDSPNAVIAYNALYTMGINANVLVEPNGTNWADKTFEDAFSRAKRHLCLTASETGYDELIRSTLNRRLLFSNGVYSWPDGMRSALLWWSPDPTN
jgi:FkbM family methyltransferase